MLGQTEPASLGALEWWSPHTAMSLTCAWLVSILGSIQALESFFSSLVITPGELNENSQDTLKVFLTRVCPTW